MNVLVATKTLPVFDVLQGIESIECQEALFTGQVYEALWWWISRISSPTPTPRRCSRAS
jgi:hypothetical protein